MKSKIKRDVLKQFQKELNEFVKGFADCSICGICCIDEKLTLYIPDINRISKNLGINKKTFIENYTHYNNETREIHMNMPCKFYKNNRCEIYDIRPKICRDYPIFVLKEGIVAINEIEACAISTHFNELFLDYCEKYHPDFYKKQIKDNEKIKNSSSDMFVKNAYYSVNIIAFFVDWLHKNK